jgi:hypothetical protein
MERAAMTLYNVHLYRLYRVKQPDIEAETMEEAIKIAEERDVRDAECIEDAEDATYFALVDVVGDEDFEQTRDFDFAKVEFIKDGGANE